MARKKDTRTDLEKSLDKFEEGFYAEKLIKTGRWTRSDAKKHAKRLLAFETDMSAQDMVRLRVQKIEFRLLAALKLLDELRPRTQNIERNLAKAEASASMNAALLDWAFGLAAEDLEDDDLEEPEEPEGD